MDFYVNIFDQSEQSSEKIANPTSAYDDWGKTIFCLWTAGQWTASGRSHLKLSLWLLWLLSFKVDTSLCYWLVHCSTFSICSVNNMLSGFFLFTGHEMRADKRILVKCSAVEFCHHLSLALVCRFGCLFLFTTYCAIKSCAVWGSRTISFLGMAFNTISVEEKSLNLSG